jgi:hypothetical protein
MGASRQAGFGLWMLAVALLFAAPPAFAEESPKYICAGCVSPAFTGQGKGSITPYGRIELDVIYSSRMTNPLDPGQFNGYATAAGSGGNSSATFNPRYSVFGVRGERTDGTHSLLGVVETDFYAQTDNAGNISPRLRLAYVKYSPNNNKTSLTAGMDWTPVMSLHPDLIDFSIAGYGGNLWQRLPQITVRHKLSENFEALLTVMRFERSLNAAQSPATQRRPDPDPANTGVIAGNNVTLNAFNEPQQHPYYGTRFAYTGTGKMDGVMAAVSAAYRYYRSAPTVNSAAASSCFGGGSPCFAGGKDINSYMVGAELVYPITPRLKFSGEIAYGQAMGIEWFRFNQELNVRTGTPIRATVGWAQLSYAHNPDTTFFAGYGFDNPFNKDLAGGGFGPRDNVQYLDNQRVYLTAVRHIWGDFYTGLEYQHLRTNWNTTVGGLQNQASQVSMSWWYNF